MKSYIKLIFLGLILNLSLAYADTQTSEAITTYQPVDEIHQKVYEHVKQKIDQKIFDPQITLRKLSKNIQLSPCQGPLNIIDTRPNDIVGRMTLRVTCKQPKWQVFVPVTVDGKQPVVITTKGILKRAVIQSEDVKQILLPYKKIPRGSMIHTSKVIGMRTKRAIAPNTAIKVRDLQPPYWVFKNKPVNIITRIGGIEVKTKGTALQSGVVDEQVTVENSRSEKQIKGIVIAPNTVLVP